MSSARHRAYAVLLGALGLVLGFPAFILTFVATQKARMPYNSEGNYFDGVVVNHAGAEYFYAILSLPFWALFSFCLIGAYRVLRRPSVTDKPVVIPASQIKQTLLGPTIVGVIVAPVVAAVSYGFSMEYDRDPDSGMAVNPAAALWAAIGGGVATVAVVVFVWGVIPLVLSWRSRR